MTDLTEALRARAGELNGTALGPALRDPFWRDRYPDRAVRFAREDGAYHLTYLVQALEAADERILTHYARWLRDVLVARGMCSLHLTLHFRRLHEAIAAAGIAGSAEALRYLSAAERALVHQGGVAGELAAALPRIAGRVRADAGASLAGLAPEGDTGDLDSLLAYLTDALAAGRPELFARACQYLGPYLLRRGCPPGGLAAALDAVASALAAEALPPDAAAAAAHVLGEGLLALAGAPAPLPGGPRDAGVVSSPGGPDGPPDPARTS